MAAKDETLLPLGHVPKAHRRIVTAGGQECAVRRKRRTGMYLGGVAGERGQLLSRADVPQLDVVVDVGSNQLAVGRKRHKAAAAQQLPQEWPFCSRSDFPEVDRSAIARGSQQLAVGRKCHSMHTARYVLDMGGFLVVCGVLQLCGCILSG